MQITFKSEEHRAAFAGRFKCNEWIAEAMGMETWDCYEETHGGEDHEPSIMVLDKDGEQLRGTFKIGTYEDEDFAWIFWNERQYFNIKA
ncbi:hypothetical protein UGMREWDR_CDS0071 [Aeromonas phage GomatiRiver_11]|nr:hypothetical protein OBDJBBDK_00065 [Aeromonas phage AhFM11]WKW84238.1 hypothetical protein UGMREWDR_CDS0071 [Aeromonas phage GomatiRiver_11]